MALELIEYNPAGSRSTETEVAKASTMELFGHNPLAAGAAVSRDHKVPARAPRADYLAYDNWALEARARGALVF